MSLIRACGLVVIGVLFTCLGYFIKSNYLYWVGPELTLETDLYDFGRLEEGESARVYLKYRNTGSMGLRIVDATSDCGCTVVDWSQSTIARGEMDSILVEYDTNTPGLVNRIVTLRSNSPDSPHLVYITGNVMPGVSTDQNSE